MPEADNESTSGNTPPCELCRRPDFRLTRHHLIPRRTHRLKRIRRRFEREDRLGRILLLCRPCHKQIHAVLSETELVETYNTRAALLEHPAIAEFVAWIADRPPGLNPRTRRPRR